MIDHIFGVEFSPVQSIVIVLGAFPYLILGAEKLAARYNEKRVLVNYAVAVYFWLVVLCRVTRFL